MGKDVMDTIGVIGVGILLYLALLGGLYSRNNFEEKLFEVAAAHGCFVEDPFEYRVFCGKEVYEASDFLKLHK